MPQDRLKTSVPKSKIRVLFQSRIDLFDVRGGDTIQILETKKGLEKLGVLVDVDLSLRPELSKYDLVHVFNLDWVCEPYLQIINAKKQGKPIVLSPIHHSLKEFEKYEKEYRFGLARIGNFLLPWQPLRDMARNVVKGIIYPPKLKPALIQLFVGIRKQQKDSISFADHIIVQTTKEAEDLAESYGVSAFQWTKVVNGVNVDRFLDGDVAKARKIAGSAKYILCVGRIEPRKNQLSLIKAFKELKIQDGGFKDVSLVCVGSLNTHHPTYIYRFKKEIRSDIHYTGFLDQSLLAGLYKACFMFVSPSWFETTGLVYLEAIVSGAKSIVASGARAEEYLRENAVYCDPGSVSSIKEAIKIARRPTVKGKFDEKVKKTYTWENCARQTLEVYKGVLNIKSQT